MESRKQNLEKLASLELEFGQNKINFVKSRHTALRMMFLVHLSYTISKFIHK
jgi:hypothetical protein